MQCLALHPDAATVVRDVCASLHGPWAETAASAAAAGASGVH
jgi:hypothetical protein